MVIALGALLIATALSACHTAQTAAQTAAQTGIKPPATVQPATADWEPAIRNQRFSVSQLMQINDRRAPEISGLAASNRQDNLFWAINDSGNKASLLAFSSSGKFRAEWQTSVKNRDWEDLASFTHAGRPYLLIADTGDNRLQYKSYKLHIFAEPEAGTGPAPDTQPLQPVATLRFNYPDGPHNSEAVAVSQVDDSIIIITKASDSSGIYSVPLSLDPASGIVTATRLGEVPVLPQSPGDGLIAKLTGIDFAVATALDINPQSNAAVLLTYREVYRWTRQSTGQSWGEVLANIPQRLARHELQQAEAVSFDKSGNAVYATSERLPAPILLLQPTKTRAVRD